MPGPHADVWATKTWRWFLMAVIAHLSALECYRDKGILDLVRARTREGAYAAGPVRLTPPSSSDASSIAERLGLRVPLHVLVGDGARRNRSGAVWCHAWSNDIDPSCLLNLDDDIYLVTPSFLYQQLCARADLENRYMLASELLGKYAISPEKPKGLLKRDPLITKADLISELGSREGEFGYAPALEAARLAFEKARSPKEAEIAALYSFNRRLGGRGIEELEVAKRLDLTPEASRMARRQWLEFDHYLPVARQDHEYDSDDNHLTREAHEKDIRRGHALKMMGMELRIMTNGQLHDWETFDTLAEHLALDNGRTYRHTSPAIKERQRWLWERLLFGKRVNGKTVFDGSGWRGRLKADKSW